MQVFRLAVLAVAAFLLNPGAAGAFARSIPVPVLGLPSAARAVQFTDDPRARRQKELDAQRRAQEKKRREIEKQQEAARRAQQEAARTSQQKSRAPWRAEGNLTGSVDAPATAYAAHGGTGQGVTGQGVTGDGVTGEVGTGVGTATFSTGRPAGRARLVTSDTWTASDDRRAASRVKRHSPTRDALMAASADQRTAADGQGAAMRERAQRAWEDEQRSGPPGGLGPLAFWRNEPAEGSPTRSTRSNGETRIVQDVGDGRFRWRADTFDTFEYANLWRETRTRRADGTVVSTLRDPSGALVSRMAITAEGEAITFFNNLPRWWPGDAALEVPNLAPPAGRVAAAALAGDTASMNRLFAAVTAEPIAPLGRVFTLDQVLLNRGVRDLMPRVELEGVHFDTDSAEVLDNEIFSLEVLGAALAAAIARNPAEVFLIEGHTDAQGDPVVNMVLSDRRAETVATLLTEAFEIPPENLVTQGYGAGALAVETAGAERRNRRVVVRRLTPLLSQEAEPTLVASLGGAIR